LSERLWFKGLRPLFVFMARLLKQGRNPGKNFSESFFFRIFANKMDIHRKL